MAYPADTYAESVELTITASNQLHTILNGDSTTEVTVEDGSKIPSVRKAMVDSLYFKPPIAWAQGAYEDTYNQLREFVDGDVRTWWFAKGATVSTPVLMTTNPAIDVNWTLWSAVTLNAATYETQKRLAAEAGLNMVGSFLLGGTVTNVGDVVFYETDGKYYGWGGALPKVVPAGSTPATSGGIGALLWVDRTDLMLRGEIEPSVFNALKQLARDSGFNLVDGSFEYGGTVATTDDVLLYKETGEYYALNSGGALIVPPRSSPDGKWTSKSGVKLKTTETVSVSTLPSGSVAKSGYTYNVNGEIAQSTGADYGHRLDAISKLNRHLGFLQQSQTRAYAAWASQVTYSDQFANLSGWTGSSPTVLQVSGGAVFANGAGASSGMCHGISAASSKFRCVTTVNYVSSSNPDGVAIGISSASQGAAPATGLADCFAIYLSKNGMKQILNGVITAHENANPLVTGVYVITVSQDDKFTSIVAKLAGGGANTEYAIRISRGTVAANNIVIFNSDVRLLSGHSIGPLAVGVGSTATLQQTGIVEGQYPTAVWTGGINADYRILTPTGYDSRIPKPAVLLFHGLGSTEKTWSSNANYFAISNALSEAGYIVISAARRGEYGTWGNANAQAAYAEAYRYLILNYNISCIACLANSMGGIEFFNSLASASVGVPVCFVGTSTTANLASCFASPSLTESIKSAYGIAAAGSNYAVKTAGYDPILYGASSFLGIPQLWLCATDDTTVVTAKNRDLMIKLASIESSQISYQTGITGGHEFDITPYLSKITTFISKYAA